MDAWPGDLEQLRLRRPQRHRRHRPGLRSDRVRGPPLRRRRRRTSGRSSWRPRRRRVRRPGPLAGPRRHPTQFDLDDEFVAGDDLATEPRLVEPTEQRQLAGEVRIGQHGARTDLGDRFAHQHTGQRRADRESVRERSTRRRSAARRPSPTRPARSPTVRRRAETAADAGAVRRDGAGHSCPHSGPTAHATPAPHADEPHSASQQRRRGVRPERPEMCVRCVEDQPSSAAGSTSGGRITPSIAWITPLLAGDVGDDDVRTVDGDTTLGRQCNRLTFDRGDITVGHVSGHHLDRQRRGR